MQRRTVAYLALLCSMLAAGCAAPGQSLPSASVETGADVDPAAAMLAAEALATVEVARTHCPQIQVDATMLDGLVRASALNQGALRDEEAFLRQMLRLNPLIESYDPATACRMLSRSLDVGASGLLLLNE